jgi:hypothetical protein
MLCWLVGWFKELLSSLLTQAVECAEQGAGKSDVFVLLLLYKRHSAAQGT